MNPYVMRHQAVDIFKSTREHLDAAFFQQLDRDGPNRQIFYAIRVQLSRTDYS